MTKISLSSCEDSEQEVPPGAAEAVQSVDYYCDSKLSLIYCMKCHGKACTEVLAVPQTALWNPLRTLRSAQCSPRLGCSWFADRNVQMLASASAQEVLSFLWEGIDSPPVFPVKQVLPANPPNTVLLKWKHVRVQNCWVFFFFFFSLKKLKYSGKPLCAHLMSYFLFSSAIILRNIAPHTVVESIMTALSPYASLAVNNIRLIKDKQTQQNRGFAFVQLSSAMVRALLVYWRETACVSVAEAVRAFVLWTALVPWGLIDH